MGPPRNATRWVTTVALCIVVSSPGAQTPTFSSRREAVRVDILVTDRGQPVRNLKIGDFEIFDSGVRQQVDLLSFEQLPLNVILALDGSVSISAEQLEHLRDGGRAVLDNLKAEDQAALLTFANAVALRERLTNDATRVRAALDQLQAADAPASGGTALIDACFTSMMLADADAGRDLLIVFTDGVDTSSWLAAERVLQAARRSSVVSYAVSTASLPKNSFLRELSDVTGGGAMEIRSTSSVRESFVAILNEFRQRYLLSFSPSGVPPTGWHPLTVRVKRRGVDVKARAGYVR
jgi:VWFA-related protein